MDSTFYTLYMELERRSRLEAAQARIRLLGYGRRGVERVPVERLPLRRLAAALARRLETWAAGAPGPGARVRA